MQSESVRKCPAKGQRSIEFFQIFFKIPPGIANISDHCVILWGRMNPHSSVPPSLAFPLPRAHARARTYAHTQTHAGARTAPPQHNACQSARRNTPLWVIHRLAIQIPTYAAVFLFRCVLCGKNGPFPNSCTRPSSDFYHCRSHSHTMQMREKRKRKEEGKKSRPECELVRKEDKKKNKDASGHMPTCEGCCGHFFFSLGLFICKEMQGRRVMSNFTQAASWSH